MDTLTIGWQRWRDGHPTDSRMGLACRALHSAAAPRARRRRFESKWEVDSDGSARDPWQFTNYVVFISPESSDIFTFTTASRGGINAVADLCKAHDRVIRRQSGCYPLVSLESDSYQHKIKSRGRIKIPRFQLVRYVDARPLRHRACSRAWRARRVAGTADRPSDRHARRAARTGEARLGQSLEIDDDVPF